MLVLNKCERACARVRVRRPAAAVKATARALHRQPTLDAAPHITEGLRPRVFAEDTVPGPAWLLQQEILRRVVWLLLGAGGSLSIACKRPVLPGGMGGAAHGDTSCASPRGRLGSARLAALGASAGS